MHGKKAPERYLRALFFFPFQPQKDVLSVKFIVSTSHQRKYMLLWLSYLDLYAKS